MDIKILSKIVASRINTVVSDIISNDQTGFVRGRHSFINIRRLLNVVHSPASVVRPEVVVSLDAEKAFDRVQYWVNLGLPRIYVLDLSIVFVSKSCSSH